MTDYLPAELANDRTGNFFPFSQPYIWSATFQSCIFHRSRYSDLANIEHAELLS